jgi:hypothetical protein
VALPPGPVQVRPKVELAVRAPLDWVPLWALLPDHAPLAVHAVAFAVDQVRVVVALLNTELGLAARLMVGVGAFTDTVADCAALPPAPVQVNVYVEVAVRLPVDCVPCTASAPDQAPEAVQAVALLAVQFRVALLPLVMEFGPTLKVTVGAGEAMVTVADCAALPPRPAQVRV